MLRHMKAIAVTLCMLVVLAACGGASEPAAPTADEVVNKLLNAFQGLQDYQGKVDMSFTTPETGELSMDVAMKGSLVGAAASGSLPQFRGEVTASNVNALPVGTIAVLGSTNYFYDPESNTVLTADQSASGKGSQLYRLPGMFMSTMTQALQNLTSAQVNQTIAGTEQIGTFSAVKLECTPMEGANPSPLAAGEKLTVWVDTATNLPVQMVFERAGGQQRMTVQSMQVNSGLADTVFAFEPPADAEVVDVTEPEMLGSLDEASDEAGFDPPTPGYLPANLPPEPTSIQVQETPLGAVIMQEYSMPVEGTAPAGQSASSGITIEALEVSADLPDRLPATTPPGANVSTVDINGNEGLLMAVGNGQASVTWQQDDMILTVRGSGGYGTDEVVKVAQGLEMN